MAIPTFEKTESGIAGLRALMSDRLRHERGQLGLTQQEFANRCGIPTRTYKRFELGECDSLDVFLKIVVAFERTRALDLLFPPKPAQVTPRSPLGALAKLEQRRLEKERSN
jgi:transcriptional regulator with XRE-family HTH domain